MKSALASLTANPSLQPTCYGLRPSHAAELKTLGEQTMSARRTAPDEVYAIVRWDGFQGAAARPEALVTVKAVVRSQDQAEAEVARLNALVEGEDIRYWWQTTRLLVEPSAGNHVA
jgi:hypothetical protein